MTHYELQLRRIERYPERHTILLKTPKLLMFVVDAGTKGEVTYIHLYDAEGRCTEAHWSLTGKR